MKQTKTARKESVMDNSNAGTEKISKAHEMVMRLLQNPSIIKENVQKLIDEEKELYGTTISEAKELYQYVLSNWRKIAPPLAAIGLSVLLSKMQATGQQALPQNANSKGHLN
jgi:hypothetical protein